MNSYGQSFQVLHQMEDALRARKYAPTTRRRYIALCARILQATHDKEPKQVATEDLEKFLAGLERSGASASTLNQAISAGTFLWKAVLDLPFPIRTRPVADRRLPVVLSPAQVKKLIESGTTDQNRLELALAYSAGLRVSEIAALRLRDIDQEGMTIFIRAGKGRKDRYVPLARSVAVLLDDFLLRHPTNDWIFPGHKAGHIKVRCIQSGMEKAREKAGILSHPTMHSLRHSYATHLVERGENLMVIKELMGHASLSSLQQYVHLAKPGILSTESPLDRPPLY